MSYRGLWGSRLDELSVLDEGGEYLLSHALELGSSLESERYHHDFGLRVLWRT